MAKVIKSNSATKQLASANKLANTKPYKVSVLVFSIILMVFVILAAAFLTRSLYFVMYWGVNKTTGGFQLDKTFVEYYTSCALVLIVLLYGTAIVLFAMLYWLIRMVFTKDEVKAKSDAKKIWIQSIVLLVVMVIAFAFSVGLMDVYATKMVPDKQAQLWETGVPICSYTVLTLGFSILSCIILIPSIIFTTKLKKVKE